MRTVPSFIQTLRYGPFIKSGFNYLVFQVKKINAIIMETKFKITQKNGQHQLPPPEDHFVDQPLTFQPNGRFETGEEVVDEVAGTNDNVETDYGYETMDETTETDEAAGTDKHQSVSSPPSYVTATPRETDETDEASDSEYVFESVENWEEPKSKEAVEESDFLLEASFADSETSEGR